MELARDWRPVMIAPPENVEPLEAVDTLRESSGQAPIAGVGDVEGEGEDRRKEGCSVTCSVVAIVRMGSWCSFVCGSGCVRN